MPNLHQITHMLIIFHPGQVIHFLEPYNLILDVNIICTWSFLMFVALNSMLVVFTGSIKDKSLRSWEHREAIMLPYLLLRCVVEERAGTASPMGALACRARGRPDRRHCCWVGFLILFPSFLPHFINASPKSRILIAFVIKAVISRRYIGRSGLLAVSDASTRGHVVRTTINV